MDSNGQRLIGEQKYGDAESNLVQRDLKSAQLDVEG